MKHSQVNILIGTACDMNCPYCLQHDGRSLADRKADPEEFAAKLAAYLGGVSPAKIMLWGGEPMLYWPRIKRLHQALLANGIRAQKGRCIFTTHGRRLTDEYVDYANAHGDLWTTVSYHNGGFTDEQTDRIFRLERFSLSFIVSHCRTDLWELRDLYWKLKERYGGNPRLCAHFVRANDSCGADWYMTKDDCDRFCEHIEREVFPMAAYGDEWARWQCSQLLYERNRYIDQPEGAMCVRPDRLSVDLHGNVYECHHDFSAENVVGNIFRQRPGVIPIRAERPDPFRFWKKCRGCPDDVRLYCRGGCYLSNTHEIDCYFARKRGAVYRKMERILR